jgi:excinuclease ABC subunit A
VLLYGSGDEDILFQYANDRGDITQREHPFEGVVHNMERRYRETESNSVRDELVKYISSQPCPDCAGSRLKRESRHVFIDNHTLAELTELPVGSAADYFTQLELPGRQGQIAEKILKEIQQRLRFLVDVGLNYLR